MRSKSMGLPEMPTRSVSSYARAYFVTERVNSLVVYAVLDTEEPSAVEANAPEWAQGPFATWYHRLAIWDSAAARIADGMPLGFGADYARMWTESAPVVEVPGAQVPLSVMPLHPHNVILQIWLELGLPGVISLGLFFYFGGVALRRASLPTPIIAVTVGALAAIVVSLMVEGSLWQVWRLAAMALAAMGVALSYSLHQQWKASAL